MTNLGGEFSKNDAYLIEEYHKHGSSDYLLTDIGDKTFVVPYKYARCAKTPENAIFLFKRDLLDFEEMEKEKYLKAGDVPLVLNCGNGESHVVPFDIKEKNFSIENFLGYVAEKSLIKYNAVIDAHRKLSALGIEKMPAAFSSAAAAKYLYKIKQYNKTLERETLVSEKPARQSVKDADKKAAKVQERSSSLRKYLSKKYKTTLVSAAIVGSGALGAGFLMQHGEDEKHQYFPIENVEKENSGVYVDYLGKVHADEYGNLARLEALKPEIMAVIYAIEGFAENTFADGHVKNKKIKKGTPTVGSGFTVLYDENGKKRRVKEGESVSHEEDIMYNSRYIDMELVPLLGDTVGRELSNEEILCSIGLGYCWGTKGFSNSKFYQALKDNEDVNELGRKISGWRTPCGILKRGYLCEQVLKGNWKAKDLLDLPVYKLKNVGFVHCSIYTLDFHWYMPCKKDKNGNYLKTKNGQEMPVILKDDYCKEFYSDKSKKVLNKLIADAREGNVSYKRVRDFMPEKLLCELQNKTDNEMIYFAYNQPNFWEKSR